MCLTSLLKEVGSLSPEQQSNALTFVLAEAFYDLSPESQLSVCAAGEEFVARRIAEQHQLEQVA